MIYSVGCEYGIRSLTKLAGMVPAGRFLLLRDILEGEELPQHFVGKIFQTLVRGNILVSAKGRGGGFALKRAPGEITLRHIVEAIDGTNRLKNCFLGFPECIESCECPRQGPCSAMRDQINDLLDKTTLSELVEMAELRKKVKAEPN